MRNSKYPDLRVAPILEGCHLTGEYHTLQGKAIFNRKVNKSAGNLYPSIAMNKNETESTEIDNSQTQEVAGFCCNVGISPVNHAVPQGHLYVLGPCGVAGMPSGHALIEKFNKIFTINRPNDFLFLFR